MLTLHAKDHPHLFELAEFLGPLCGQAWLVGGTIRDLLLDNHPADYDIAFSGDLSAKVLAWSQQQQGSWFWLDKERNQSRVMLDNGRLQFDFAPLRAATIQEDLRLRDYTLNAIALPLKDLTTGGLIDPLDGVADLQAGRLRCCSGDVLKDDPLRCLKGIRHHAQHGWTFTPETIDQLRAAAPLISQIAGERLRTELSHILAGPHLSSAIDLLEETHLAQELFPKFRGQEFQIGLSHARKQLALLSAFEPIVIRLEENYEPLLNLHSLLILALIFICTTDFIPALIERLRLSRRSSKLIDSLLRSEPARIDFDLQDSPRISALKVERIGTEPIAQLLFTLLRYQGTELISLSSVAITHFINHLSRERIPDLLGGNALREKYPALSGKEIGLWLERIKAAEINEEISSVGEAEAWLDQQFSI